MARLSERQQIAAIMAGAALVLLSTWLAVLRPLQVRRRGLESRIEQLTTELRQQGYLLGEQPLQHERLEAERALRAMVEEWSEVSEKLRTFTNQDELISADVTTIDYKTELERTRHRLLRQSFQTRIRLPPDLGMPGEVLSNEDARVLMLQLQTVERVTSMLLGMGIDEVPHLLPHSPNIYTVGQDRQRFMEEYPISVDFFGDFQSFSRLGQEIRQSDHLLVLRHLRAEKAELERPDRVLVRAVISSLLFTRRPEEMAPIRTQPFQRAFPRGY